MSKPDYQKMNQAELRTLLLKHQEMLKNKSLINALPDKGERFHKAISEIERFLTETPSPMDFESITNQMSQLKMSTEDLQEIQSEKVHLDTSKTNELKKSKSDDFSEARLNEVKERLKAKEKQRKSENHVNAAKLIPLNEAIRLLDEHKKQAEERLIQQTTARLLGNMSLANANTAFGLPKTNSSKNSQYRRTAMEKSNDSDEENDELGRDKAEIVSDHDSDEIDYPDKPDGDESDEN